MNELEGRKTKVWGKHSRRRDLCAADKTFPPTISSLVTVAGGTSLMNLLPLTYSTSSKTKRSSLDSPIILTVLFFFLIILRIFCVRRFIVSIGLSSVQYLLIFIYKDLP